jgi:putative colanic acid biosynthesis glycosyltransferase
MKLLQICVEGNTGSTGTIAEAIGSIAISKGWESYIAFGRFPRPSVSNLIRIGSDLDTWLHGIETRLFDRHGLGSRRATRNLVRQIDIIKPDIIHLHHIHGYYINIVILFEYLAKVNIPVVWTFHDCWSFTGHCAFFDYAGCNKWETECNHCPQKLEYPKSLVVDRSQKNFRLKRSLFTSLPNMVIVSVSRWLDDLVARSFLKETRHTYIYNGIDTEVFKPSAEIDALRTKYHMDGKFLLLGAATTWDRRKGLKDFIALSKLLNPGEIIVLIGLDEEQRKNLPQNIIGLPRTDSRATLVEWYNVADVFLNLSVEETFGLTTAESMACGTPVIVYNKTASPELVREGAGFVVSAGDNSGLVNAIQNIKRSGKSAYSAACREHAVSKFNVHDRFNEYFDLYGEIVGNGISRSGSDASL